MGFAQAKFQSVMTGSEEQRIEALRQLLDYPLKEKDSEGSKFWYLRPGNDKSQAEDTCPIAIGTGDNTNLKVVTALKLKYFGPNGEPIEDKTETIFWNNVTGKVDGHGQAIATGFKTPELSDVVPTQPLLSLAETTYQQLVNLKEQRQAELEQPEIFENISLTSERLTKINQRLQAIESVPKEITGQMVRATLKILQQHKTKKAVQLLLRSLTDSEKSELNDNDFIKDLVNETGKLALLDYETTKPTALTISVEAILIRI